MNSMHYCAHAASVCYSLSVQSPTGRGSDGDGGLATPTSLEAVMLRLLQTVLGYSLSLARTRSSTPSQESKYWQGLLTKTYSITDKVHNTVCHCLID